MPLRDITIVKLKILFQHGNTALHEAAWKGFSLTLSFLCQVNYKFIEIYILEVDRYFFDTMLVYLLTLILEMNPSTCLKNKYPFSVSGQCVHEE